MFRRFFDKSCDKIARLISPSILLPQEPSTKRVRPLGRVTSLANLISPVKNGAVRRFGQTIQVSSRDIKPPPQKRKLLRAKGTFFAILHVAPNNLTCNCNMSDIWGFLFSHVQASFRGDGKSPGVPQKPCSKAAAPTPPKRRNSMLWSETLDVHQKGTFSTKEIKRQEVRISTETWTYSRNGGQIVGHG